MGGGIRSGYRGGRDDFGEQENEDDGKKKGVYKRRREREREETKLENWSTLVSF